MTATASPAEPRSFADAERALAASLPGYTARKHQQDLAAQIERSIDIQGTLLAEAGTGTGKSLAAVIPAILSHRRTIVATATKALQNQYTDNDLPFLQKHLGVDFDYALLKGRSNYPCESKLSELEYPSPGQEAVIARIREAEHETGRDGRPLIVDRDVLPTVSDKDWQGLSMSSDDCPGRSVCPFGKNGECLSFRAKDRAATADVVVTNMAYLAVDLMLRKETRAEVALLGPIQQLVLDEAHNLDNAVTNALAYRLALGTFKRLYGDSTGLIRQEIGQSYLPSSSLLAAAEKLWEKITSEYETWQAHRRELHEDAELMIVTDAMRLSVLGDELTATYNAVRDLWNVVSKIEIEGLNSIIDEGPREGPEAQEPAGPHRAPPGQHDDPAEELHHRGILGDRPLVRVRAGPALQGQEGPGHAGLRPLDSAQPGPVPARKRVGPHPHRADVRHAGARQDLRRPRRLRVHRPDAGPGRREPGHLRGLARRSITRTRP